MADQVVVLDLMMQVLVQVQVVLATRHQLHLCKATTVQQVLQQVRAVAVVEQAERLQHQRLELAQQIQFQVHP
jgi:hypothetical protein